MYRVSCYAAVDRISYQADIHELPWGVKKIVDVHASPENHIEIWIDWDGGLRFFHKLRETSNTLEIPDSSEKRKRTLRNFRMVQKGVK